MTFSTISGSLLTSIFSATAFLIKSWTVANILEKATNLKSINSIVFDLHGEYKPLQNLPNTTLLKIAGAFEKTYYRQGLHRTLQK
jgi:hypothetical protein